jgi:general secretion pathway protein G
MTLSRKPSWPGRGGFTLIELLVVIAIISILMALTAAAVLRTLGVGPRVKTRTELGQLDGAMEAFKAKYKVNMVPSRLALRKFSADYNLQRDPTTGNPVNPLDYDSYTYLTAVFPGLGKTWQTRGINWHTSWVGVPATQKPFEILEGDQCLVFFLGGIETTNPNGCLGFSIDSANPDKPFDKDVIPPPSTQPGERVSFYDFNSPRLFIPLDATTKKPLRGPNTVFLSYADGYGRGDATVDKPYLYFSTYGIENNYNRYLSLPQDPKKSDCKTFKVWPYAEALQPIPRYVKPKTFQIISAGTNQTFGTGTVADGTVAVPFVWTAGTAAQIGADGQDDLANFSAGILSNGPQ